MTIVGGVELAFGLGRVALSRIASGVARTATETASGPVSRGPNPGGRHGGPAHRATVDAVASELEASGATIIAGGGRLPERAVQVAGGRVRFPDIIAQQADGSMTYVNVGRQTKAGAPVAREARALEDLAGTGIEAQFIPYNK